VDRSACSRKKGARIHNSAATRYANRHGELAQFGLGAVVDTTSPSAKTP
jgi:hypothetical protein